MDTVFNTRLSHRPLVFPETIDLSNNYMNLMPPLRPRNFEYTNILPFPQISLNSPESTDQESKSDLKERNRIAAQKWRQKKDGYLGELENINDSLREQVFKLQSQTLTLKVENKVLEDELQFFQKFMSKIMSNNNNTTKK